MYISIYLEVQVADEVLCLVAMHEFDGVEVLYAYIYIFIYIYDGIEVLYTYIFIYI